MPSVVGNEGLSIARPGMENSFLVRSIEAISSRPGTIFAIACRIVLVCDISRQFTGLVPLSPKRRIARSAMISTSLRGPTWRGFPPSERRM